jgi:hypothetical protein
MLLIRLLAFHFILCGLISCVSTSSPPWQEVISPKVEEAPSLVGRWKSDTCPTGYWIIDRYPDGRYASKLYLCYDTNRPHEVAIKWGRWKLERDSYHHVMDGTNSEPLKRFQGKWRDWPVTSQTHDCFTFEVNDGRREETRVSITAPLPTLKLPYPQDSKYGGTRPKWGIIERPLDGIPAWLYQTP